MITSSQNPKLKLVRSLMGRAKERREAKAFVIEGVRLIEEAVSAGWKFQFVKMIPAARSFGKPKMPVEIAGMAMVEHLSSSATRREPVTASDNF